MPRLAALSVAAANHHLAHGALAQMLKCGVRLGEGKAALDERPQRLGPCGVGGQVGAEEGTGAAEDLEEPQG